MTNKLIKYLSILGFLAVVLTPRISRHSVAIKKFYDSDNYDYSMVFLILSLMLLQIYRYNYDIEYKSWLLLNKKKIIIISSIISFLISIFFIIDGL